MGFCVSACAQHAVQHTAAEHAVLLYLYLAHLIHLHLWLAHDVIGQPRQSQCIVGVGTSRDQVKSPTSSGLLDVCHLASCAQIVQFGRAETLSKGKDASILLKGLILRSSGSLHTDVSRQASRWESYV